jgi:hypothetical protein
LVGALFKAIYCPKKNGIKTRGVVVSFITYQYNIFFKNAEIPKFSFSTFDGRRVVNTPVHTLFIELSMFRINDDYEILYSKAEPEKFIVNSTTGLWVSLSLVLVDLFYLGWFISILTKINTI